MAGYSEQAGEITSLLNLGLPPVALTVTDDPPPAATRASELSPSSCAFWRRAETSVFYATAEQHYNCQIGAMVMGFGLPPEVTQQIGGLVESMSGCGYLSPEEAAKIPSVGGGAAGILYGPLAQFPVQPDVVLFWLKPTQAMVYHEAVGSASWTAAPTRTGGRPGCSAIPMAMQDGRAVLSLGCAGMRTFTEIAEDQMLAAVPGGKLGELIDALRVTVSANGEMESYYTRRKAEVAAAEAAR